jgi:acyl carrier protein
VDTLKQVRDIVADVTQCQVETITEQSNTSNVDGWDSVAQINIIVAVETEFGVTFTAEEIHSLNSVRQILDALKRSALPIEVK